MPLTPKLVEKQIRFPVDVINRVEELGAHGGLTGEQMLQAIIILDLFHTGWIKPNTPEPKKDPLARRKAPAKKPK